MGVDGRTAEEYEERLEKNLQSLQVGPVQGTPVRRTYIPKGDGKEQRPIGIPTFERQGVLQRAVTIALEAVYEQDFLTLLPWL